MQIRLAGKLSYDSIVDGPGLRMVVWTQGCSHNCFNCHNPQTHDPNGGFSAEVDDLVEEIVKYPLKNGVTLSGGEPFEQPDAIYDLVLQLKKHHINIWSFTGYTFEQILNDPIKKKILDYIDVLIDGPFINDQKDISLIFRGSKNQRIIDVQKSLAQNQVVLFDL